MRTSRFRTALLLGGSMLALVLAAQPVAAATVISASGTFGLAVIPDAAVGKQGANCDYKTSGSNGHFRLKDMSARGPKIYAHDTGSGTQHQWVGWKYKIQGDTNADNVFGTKFTSTVVKAKATDSTPAAFARRTWTAPSNLKQGNYRVQVTLIWYKPGSSTQVQGKQVANVDYYKVAGGGPDTVRNNNCYYKN
jgi:hypothetical protein